MNLAPVQIKGHIITNIQAFKKIMRELNISGEQLTPYKEALKAQYPNGLTACELDTFIKEYEEDYHVSAQANTL